MLDFWRWPAASPQAFWGLTAVFVGLFAAAVGIDLLRKRMAQQRLIAQAWEQARAIADEKDISDAEWGTLEEAIARFAPKDPLGVVTERRRFNECVSAYMAWLRRRPTDYAETGTLLRELRSRLALDFIPIGQRIETTRELARGQTLLANRARDKAARWFSLPLVYVDEAYLHAAWEPKGADPPPPLNDGDELRCRIWREDDARYSFSLTVADANGADQTVLLYHAAGVRRIQSRQHFRIRHNQIATAGVVPSSPDDEFEDVADRPSKAPVRVRITSLSAGGLAYESPQPLPTQSVVRVGIKLHEGGPIMVHARVVGVSPMMGGRHLVRGAFVGLGDEDRDRIAKYVWWRQQPKPNPDDAIH